MMRTILLSRCFCLNIITGFDGPSIQELMGADGRIYLRLADGRGWAFDDSTLFPQGCLDLAAPV